MLPEAEQTKLEDRSGHHLYGVWVCGDGNQPDTGKSIQPALNSGPQSHIMTQAVAKMIRNDGEPHTCG